MREMLVAGQEMRSGVQQEMLPEGLGEEVRAQLHEAVL